MIKLLTALAAITLFATPMAFAGSNVNNCSGASICTIGGGIGAKGDRGPKGHKGDRGIAGTNGVAGIAGTNGTNGINGINGADGTDGMDGINGADGADATLDQELVDRYIRNSRYTDKHVSAGIATATAAANHHFDVSPNAGAQIAISGATFNGQSAASVAFGAPVGERVFINWSLTSNSGPARSAAFGVGATLKLGQ